MLEHRSHQVATVKEVLLLADVGGDNGFITDDFGNYTLVLPPSRSVCSVGIRRLHNRVDKSKDIAYHLAAHLITLHQ